MTFKKSVVNNYAPKCAVPTCINRVSYHKAHIKANGTPYAKYKTFCHAHRDPNKLKSERDNFMMSRGGCEQCGYSVLEGLTVDHIDGNRHNIDPSNLQILCANCHNIKSKENKDYNNRYTLINTHAEKLFEF